MSVLTVFDMLRIITIKFNHFFNKTIKSIDKNEKGSELTEPSMPKFDSLSLIIPLPVLRPVSHTQP